MDLDNSPHHLFDGALVPGDVNVEVLDARMRFCVDIASGEKAHVTAVYPPRGEVTAQLNDAQAVAVSLPPPNRVSAALMPPPVGQIITMPELMMVQAQGPSMQSIIVSTGQGPPGPEGPVGPQGPPGPAGGNAFEVVAGAALSGHRVVRHVEDGRVNYASSDRVEDGNQILGITLHAAVENDDITVQASGYIDEVTWSWELGQLYCGVDGQITQTPPVTGFVCRIGRATKPTQIYVGIEEAIILA